MATEDLDELITIPKGAKWLGVSETLVYRAVENGTLPHKKHGPYTFVTKRALKRWNDDPETHRKGPKQKG